MSERAQIRPVMNIPFKMMNFVINLTDFAFKMTDFGAGTQIKALVVTPNEVNDSYNDGFSY